MAMRSIVHPPPVRLLLCLTSACLAASGGVAVGMANHEGWPAIGHHQGHPNDESGVMRGELGVHNMLLGATATTRSGPATRET
jgi:hypothetical protein